MTPKTSKIRKSMVSLLVKHSTHSLTNIISRHRPQHLMHLSTIFLESNNFTPSCFANTKFYKKQHAPPSLKISGRSQIFHYKARVLQVFLASGAWRRESPVLPGNPQKASGNFFPLLHFPSWFYFLSQGMCIPKTKCKAAFCPKNIWANQNFFHFSAALNLTVWGYSLVEIKFDLSNRQRFWYIFFLNYCWIRSGIGSTALGCASQLVTTT